LTEKFNHLGQSEKQKIKEISDLNQNIKELSA